jgi:hypothetical protein
MCPLEKRFWQEPPSLCFVNRVVLRLLSSLDRTGQKLKQEGHVKSQGKNLPEPE